MATTGTRTRKERRPLMNIEPIRRETVMETVVVRIKDLLSSGNLKAGDRLPPEPELARMLRVSRSSLREALKGLMFLGLLKARPGDGTYIQSSLDRVLNQHFQWMILLQEVKHLEIYELRKIIEPEAAALAAKRASTADVERMAEAIKGMHEDLYDGTRFHARDIEFHEAFMQASGNVALQATMRMLFHATTEARLRVLPLIDDMETHWRRHDRVFRAIRDRKPELARKAVMNDLLYAETLLRKHLQSFDPHKTGSRIQGAVPELAVQAGKTKEERR